MEYINRIELQGRVGTARIGEVNGSKVANFSLATEHLYKSRESGAVAETTWHYVVAWNGPGMPEIEKITKGAPVHVTGRLRLNRYTGADGSEKQIYEIMAQKVRILTPDEAGKD